MNRDARALLRCMSVLALSLLGSNRVQAQDAGATLSGVITNQAGAVVPSVKISIKNVVTGQSTETQADSAGVYNVPNLVAGDYEISVTAEGFSTNTAQVNNRARNQSNDEFGVGWGAHAGGPWLLSGSGPGKCEGSGQAR